MSCARAWAEGISAKDPAYFEQLATGQAPDYLWIGCSDSRVPVRSHLIECCCDGRRSVNGYNLLLNSWRSRAYPATDWRRLLWLASETGMCLTSVSKFAANRSTAMV